MQKLTDLENGSILLHPSGALYYESFEKQSVKILSLKPLEGEPNANLAKHLEAAKAKEKKEKEEEEIAKKRIKEGVTQ